MSKIRIVLELPGRTTHRPVKVESTKPIGELASSLASQLGYPLRDHLARPIPYSLFSVPEGVPLPHDQSMADLQLVVGVHLLLDSAAARYATVPIELSRMHPVVPSPVPPRRWSRRSLLFTGSLLVGFSLTGLGAGSAAALAQRFFSSRETANAPHVPRRSTSKMLQSGLVFSTHRNTVRSVAWSPDGATLASGGDDSFAFVWRPDGTVQQRIAHPAPVLSLAWSPESQRIVTCAGNQVAFFHALTGAPLARSTHRHAANVSSVAWTPHNQMQVVSGGMDKRAVVWETTTYQAQVTFTRHDTPIEAVSWGADGQTVASSSQGGAVRVWDAETALETHGFYQDAPLPMRSCAFAPSGTTLAVGGNDGVTRVWNGFLCQQQEGPMCQDIPLRLTSSNKPVRSLAWSPNGRYLASGDDGGSFTIWCLTQRQTPLFTITIAAGNAIHSLAWSPGSDQLATASGNTVILWKLAT